MEILNQYVRDTKDSLFENKKKLSGYIRDTRKDLFEPIKIKPIYLIFAGLILGGAVFSQVYKIKNLERDLEAAMNINSIEEQILNEYYQELEKEKELRRLEKLKELRVLHI